MPTYTYRAITSTNRHVTGREQALNETVLAKTLKKAGIHVRAGTVREVRGFNSPYRLNLSAKDIGAIFENLETQLTSQVNVTLALAGMIKTAKNAEMKLMLKEILQQVESGGKKPSEAFAMFPRTFSPGMIATIKAGQHLGMHALGERFGRLRLRLEFKERMKRIIRKGLEYPAFVLFALVCLIVFFLETVIPVLESTLLALGSGLPRDVKFVIAAAHAVQNGWGWMLGGLVVLAGALTWLLKRPAIRSVADKWVLKAPYFGHLLSLYEMSVIFWEFAASQEGGVPTTQNLADCAKQVSNREFRAALFKIRDDIIAGKSLYQAFDATGLFPADACAVIHAGEAAGPVALTQNMRRRSEYAAAKAEQTIERSVVWFERFTFMAVALMVGYVASTFYSAIFAVPDAIKGF